MSSLKQSIIEIAKEAGVAPSTVSRVINQHPDVSEKTRARVLEVVERLAYRPNPAARSLITQRTNTVAMITSNLDHYGPAGILFGAEKVFQSLGYKLYITIVDPHNLKQITEVLNDLLSYRVDGIMWSVLEIDHMTGQLEKLMTELEIPVICASADLSISLPSVVCDNYMGGYMAAEHLVQQGYQNIGAITGEMRYLVTQERLEGFEDALKKYDKSFTSRQVVEGDWTSASGVESFHTLVQQFPEIDAVFVHNDRMALGVLKAAHDLGWQVPDRLGVVGFDNLPESTVSIPTLTTIRNPLEEIGQAAAEHLDQILREPVGSEKRDTAPFRLVIKPEIISRASSVRREG